MTANSAPGISRDDALVLLKEYLKNDNLVSHCIASEAIMRALARKLNQDEDVWGIAGLLHDIDYEITNGELTRHGKEAPGILLSKGVSSEIADAIKNHNAEGLGLERSTLLDHALTCAESITGLIVATALVYPDKKVASVKPKSITKRMKQKEFARSVNREHIRECEKIGIPLEQFAELSLKAMREISDVLGL